MQRALVFTGKIEDHSCELVQKESHRKATWRSISGGFARFESSKLEKKKLASRTWTNKSLNGSQSLQAAN
jgi:hypothetical protein